ncbi:MAG TPA: ABC transporter ATP-binding protein [Roseobacter sp.]|uniref:ABC transporter domain-containing protein n=1 Tax=marine sediment metagenome TaxID=412755 RepID=A0A0F9R1Q6_9ZZZZ|nr:ABC transporter ATP-binding protein [Roseobacter sp.]
MNAFVSLKGITKKYGDFTALNNVNIELGDGRIHAVMGENGAGKTTLMNIIYGLDQPTSGEVWVNNTPVKMSSPKDALHLGIGMIHQHFMLVDTLTVAENIVLGLEGQGMSLDLKTHEAKIAVLSEEYGLNVDPKAEIWTLSMGMRQRVEIVKALYRDVKLLILDEPTSVLTPTEVGTFLDGLERLKARGKSVAFITHKLDEVMAVADDITVMRHGAVTQSTPTADITKNELAASMMGADFAGDLGKSNKAMGDVLLSIEGVSVVGEKGNLTLNNVSLNVKAGEILGVAGVDGNGQDELADAISGMAEIDKGEIYLSGVPVSSVSVKDRRQKHQLGYVPADRHGTAVVMNYSVAMNGALRDYSNAPYSKYGIMQNGTIRDVAESWVEDYDIRLHSVDQEIRFLSGGNQQKLVFAREIESGPEIFMVVQPCKGLDIGAINTVQQNVLALKEAGKAVLYISTELEHILAVADRVAVMCEGQVTGIIKPEEASGERMGLLMAGVREDAS